MYPLILKALYKEFKRINWLPTEERVEQRVATKLCKYWKGTPPFYVNELCSTPEIHIKLHNICPWRYLWEKVTLGQKNILFLRSSISNELSNDLKVLTTTTSFTHNYKKVVWKSLMEYNTVISIIEIFTIIVATITVITFWVIIILIIVTKLSPCR